jgi:hypothetical protein
MDEVASYLEEQDDSDFIRARALLELKKSDKNFKIEDLIDINTLCL